MLEYAWCFPQNIYTIMIKYHNERHNSNSCKRQVVQDAFESCTCIHSHPGVDRIWKIPTILTKTGISLNIPYSISGWLQSYMHFHHKLFLSGVFSCARAWPYYCSSWKIAIKSGTLAVARLAAQKLGKPSAMDFIDENYREKPKIWCSKSSTCWLIHHHVLIDHRISVKFMCKCRLEFTYSTSTYRLGCFELFQVSNLHSNRNTQRVLWLCFLVRPLYYGWMILAPWAFQSHDKKNGLLWVKEWIYYGFGCFVFPGNPEYCCEKKGLEMGKRLLEYGLQSSAFFLYQQKAWFSYPCECLPWK